MPLTEFVLRLFSPWYIYLGDWPPFLGAGRPPKLPECESIWVSLPGGSLKSCRFTLLELYRPDSICSTLGSFRWGASPPTPEIVDRLCYLPSGPTPTYSLIQSSSLLFDRWANIFVLFLWASLDFSLFSLSISTLNSATLVAMLFYLSWSLFQGGLISLGLLTIVMALLVGDPFRLLGAFRSIRLLSTSSYRLRSISTFLFNISLFRIYLQI